VFVQRWACFDFYNVNVLRRNVWHVLADKLWRRERV
jgi:hypothetical protein